MEKYYENEEKFLIKISKEIAQKLNSNYGVPFGENGISHTLGKGRKKTYYLCESTKNMQKYHALTTK